MHAAVGTLPFYTLMRYISYAIGDLLPRAGLLLWGAERRMYVAQHAARSSVRFRTPPTLLRMLVHGVTLAYYRLVHAEHRSSVACRNL